MYRSWKLLALGVMTLGLVSCYPDRFDDIDVESLDTVSTVFNPESDFDDYQTFSVSDMVVHIVGEGEADNITRAYDDLILDRVRTNMLDLGYTEVIDPGEDNVPDVTMAVYITSTDYLGVIDYPGYCWYPYYCGWGWYYPPSYIYSYTIGSLGISMLDLKNPDMEAERLVIPWTAIIRGPVGTSSVSEARIGSGPVSIRPSINHPIWRTSDATRHDDPRAYPPGTCDDDSALRPAAPRPPRHDPDQR